MQKIEPAVALDVEDQIEFTRVFLWQKVAALYASGVQEHIDVPARHRDLLLRELLQMPWLPELDLPEELQFKEVRLPGRPMLKIRRSTNS